jgi:hypothetical protein
LRLERKDLNNMVWQERMLELGWVKREPVAPWPRGKEGDGESGPQGGKGCVVPDFGSARGGPTASWRGARVVGSTAQTTALAGGTQPSIHGIVTPMVELRKLTRELINCFPDPSADPVLQTKGLPRNRPVSRPFFSSKIVQNRAKPAQKVAKLGRKSGFMTTDFMKTCQVRRLVSSPVSAGRPGGPTERDMLESRSPW